MEGSLIEVRRTHSLEFRLQLDLIKPSVDSSEVSFQSFLMGVARGTFCKFSGERLLAYWRVH